MTRLENHNTAENSLSGGTISFVPAKGWYSGDLHVHRAIGDVPLLMQAEDLYVAPVITWWNNRNLWSDREVPENPLVQFNGNRYYHVMAGEDEREGGALMYFNCSRFLPIAGSSREYPSPMKFVNQARGEGDVWIDVEKPFWWDVPVWLASGQIDSVGLANNHMCRSRMYESEAWGRPRDTRRLPPPRGNGYWTQENKRHIGRRSAQFFLGWVDERIARIPQKLQDPDKLKEVLAHHEEAKAFWRQVLVKANAE